MSEVRVVGRVKRVGHSLAFFVPAPDARRAGLRDGQTIDATLRTEVPAPFGLLRDLPYRAFARHREERRRDRL